MTMMMKKLHIMYVVLMFLLCNINSFSIGIESAHEHANSTMARCIERERHALLMFKRGIFEYGWEDLSSWGSEEDCCKWEGVECSSLTGHVTSLHLLFVKHISIKMTSSLIELKSLNHLTLSGNDFRSMPIPKFIGSLTGLVYLDLSSSNLSGPIPYELRNLSNLKVLDLSNNNFVSSPIPDFIASFTKLEDLDLGSANFSGAIPYQLGNLSNLKVLDLSHNEGLYLKDGNLEWLSRLSSLEELGFSGVDLSRANGWVDIIKALPFLSNLKLGGCNLSRVDFKGWSSLGLLNLSNNRLVGVVPVFRECPSLKELILSNNNFSALLPETFRQLLNLESLDISNNSLEVVITKEHFSNLSNLSFLDLSFNTNISFNWSPQHVSPDFQLSVLYLSTCKLGPRFPDWIKTQKFMTGLDLSNNEISDSIPTWFWDLTSEMRYLNLSSNKIGGIVPNVNSTITLIDLSSNNFEGPIPSFLVNGTSLNLSRNKFSGNLSFLQAPTRGDLQHLDVSHNYLLGEILDYWINFKDMRILNFAYNNLSGGIPSSLGFLMQLQVLDLHRNKLSGELPMFLRNCTQLNFLNLGANKFFGHIPAWMGEISKLYVLIMRSNEFLGSIPLQLCQLRNLQFLDLSTNKISGKIPGCFNNFTGMIRQHGTRSKAFEHYLRFVAANPFYDHAPVVWKGGEYEFGKNLEYLKSIDLSSNKLNGELPETIFALKELVSLNISKNDICGNIPPEIGNLKSLESLDLSNNRISGGIPASMSFLNFLSYLDLSNNNLSGKIPAGTQLQGFNVSTYIGNSALCGTPLVQKCPGDESSQVPSISADNENEGKDEFDRWFYIGAALGFSTTFWGICGALFLNRRWRHAYFLYLDNLKDWIYVIVKVYIAKLRRI